MHGIYRVCLLALSLLHSLSSQKLTTYTNHLAGENSPYLREHIHQPVEWYPWGEEAFSKAAREHKLIFLSIGFRSCHWCHEMSGESFEDPGIAAMLNRGFVAVIVDREERPDIDSHFQKIYRAFSGKRGGWPLNIILDENMQPLYAGTFIPGDDAYGVMGMRTLLPYFEKLNRSDEGREKIRAMAADMRKRLQKFEEKEMEKDSRRKGRDIVSRLLVDYDTKFAGFGKTPKYPKTPRLSLLLDIYALDGDGRALRAAMQTLEKMAKSGLYDQIDGGFFRYCSDRRWKMPHFEKMLYTNALLISLYVKAWKISPKKIFSRVVTESLAEIDKRFRTDVGLYYSASDADSDKEEGAYFLHIRSRSLEALLKAGFSHKDAEAILDYLDIEADGNFDGEAAQPNIVGEREPGGFQKARKVLSGLRERRSSYPFIDYKIITSYNAMMLEALLRASSMDEKYLKEALAGYRELKRRVSYGDSELHRLYTAGGKAEGRGVLEDYAFFISTAIEAYEKSYDESYLDDAVAWCDKAVELFFDSKKASWHEGTSFVESRAGIEDGIHPSSLSIMLENLLKLALLRNRMDYAEYANRTLSPLLSRIDAHPLLYTEAYRAKMMLERGIYLLKAKKERLLSDREKIDAISYPYLLTKAENIETYMLCGTGVCYEHGDTPEQLEIPPGSSSFKSFRRKRESSRLPF